jgi:glycosyltransferase involved in cell wall biosynthesis
VRVLYANHTSQVSGAEWSLLSLIESLPPDYTPILACPRGALADAARALGVPVEIIAGTDASLRFHAVHTSRGLYDAGSTTRELVRLAREIKPDLVHANSIRTGLIAAAAAAQARVPTIAHVHDRLPQGRVPTFMLKRMVRAVDGLFACSSYVAEPLWALNPPRPVKVVYNPVDVERFGPSPVSREMARSRLGLGQSTAVLAVVAQIIPWKAQDDAVRILAELKREHPDVCLLLVGSPKFTSRAARYDSTAFAGRLDRLVSSLGVQEEVRFLGERDDVPEVLRAADIVLVPSWAEPFGMCVIEAMAMELPVLATSVGGPKEVITHGRDGLLLPPREPTAWAAAASRLLRDSELRGSIGRAARQRVVERMNAAKYVDRVLEGYAESLWHSRRRADGSRPAHV